MLKLLDNKEIYELREQGLSYSKIAEYFGQKGISVSYNTINRKCKEIYLKKGKEQPDIKQINVSDKEIYDLKEQGLTYKEMIEYFKRNSINIGYSTIQRRCKEIYSKLGKERPKIKYRKVSDKEIYDLIEQGLKHKEIVERFREKGISVNYVTIRKRCKEIYSELGKEEPGFKMNYTKEISDEEIYELREQGLTHKEIVEYFRKKGISVSRSTIQSRCKEIYSKLGKEQPKIEHTKVSDEEIYELREQGLTHKEIIECFRKKGISVSYTTIQSRCKKIYSKLGKEQPDIKYINVSDKEIYELSQQGLSNKKIAEHFRENGIRVADSFIKTRIGKIYELERIAAKESVEKISDKEMRKLIGQGLSYEEIAIYFQKKGLRITPEMVYYKHRKMKTMKVQKEKRTKTDNKQLINGILNLVTTRKATVEQIKKIAEYYEVDLIEVLYKGIDER